MQATSLTALTVSLLGFATAGNAQVFHSHPSLTFSPELTVAEVDERSAFNADPDGGTPATTGRSNLALAANGGIGFESSRISQSYGDDKINNGVYGAVLPVADDATRPWISASDQLQGFAGVALGSASTVGAIGFGSRIPGRSDGLFTLQVTTQSLAGVDLEDSGATGALSWKSVGSLESTTAGEFGRHVVQFAPVADVTAVRVVVSQAGTTITEIEAYSSVDVVIRAPELGLQPGPTEYSRAILADGPIHYYRFEETAKNQLARDEVGDQHGVYSGGSSSGGKSATGALGRAATFDGYPGSFVDLGTPFHPGPTISVEAWVNVDPESVARFGPIAARWDGSFEVDYDENSQYLNLATRNAANEFSVAWSVAPIAKGDWHHVVGIFENGISTVYLNGIRGPSRDVSNTSPLLQDAGATLLIGASRDGNEFVWNGRIDEVAFYDYALSEDQILDHIAASGRADEIGPFSRGDCNNDGAANIADGIFLLNFLFGDGATPRCDAACDSGAGGSLNIATAIYLFNHLFGTGDPPPAPFETCEISARESDLAVGCQNPQNCR